MNSIIIYLLFMVGAHNLQEISSNFYNAYSTRYLTHSSSLLTCLAHRQYLAAYVCLFVRLG